MSKNFHTAYSTGSEYTPESMNIPLEELDEVIGYLKNVMISCDGQITADTDTGVVTWNGAIRIAFTNDSGIIVENTVAAGSVTVAGGSYMYVILNKTNATILTMQTAPYSAGGSSAPIGKNTVVIAYRNNNSGEFYVVNALAKMAVTTAEAGVSTVTLASGVSGSALNLLAINSAGDGTYVLADNADITTLQDVVIAKQNGTGVGGTIQVAEYGYVNGFAGLTVGVPVYVGTAGAITQTAPTTSGAFVKCVGYAISASTIKFMPDTLAVQLA